MLKFSDYLLEQEHKSGTYASLNLSSESAKELHDWCKDNDIKDICPASTFHCTVIYSRKALPSLKDKEVKLPITATIKNWEIFPQKMKDDKALVMLLKSDIISNLHKECMEIPGATYDYPSYKAHVTCSTKFIGTDLPKSQPKFKLIFDFFDVKPLIDP